MWNLFFVWRCILLSLPFWVSHLCFILKLISSYVFLPFNLLFLLLYSWCKKYSSQMSFHKVLLVDLCDYAWWHLFHLQVSWSDDFLYYNLRSTEIKFDTIRKINWTDASWLKKIIFIWRIDWPLLVLLFYVKKILAMLNHLFAKWEPQGELCLVAPMCRYIMEFDNTGNVYNLCSLLGIFKWHRYNCISLHR